jgi:hypothetical protein
MGDERGRAQARPLSTFMLAPRVGLNAFMPGLWPWVTWVVADSPALIRPGPSLQNRAIRSDEYGMKSHRPHCSLLLGPLLVEGARPA